MKIAGGLQENGIVVGNAYDKYGSNNALVRWIMQGFARTLDELVDQAQPRSIHEIGCGEGYWVLQWTARGIAARGSDFSEQVIALARENAAAQQVTADIFSARSIYDVEPQRDRADLVVCCEVLEHLEDPQAGLDALQRIVDNFLILSVPQEPLWCVLNMARGKYLASLGNTPGHMQHWSSGAFVALVGRYFDIIEIRKPLPWTMLLCRARRQAQA